VRRRPCAKVGIEKFFDCVMARSDRVEREQRIDIQLHSVRAPTAVESFEDESSRIPCERRRSGDQLQMTPGSLVDRHVLGALVGRGVRDAPVMAESFFDIVERDSSRADY